MNRTIKCTVCGGTGKVHYWVCGVDVTDSCPICAGLGIIPAELHELVEVRPMKEVYYDRI
jgi:DnaJ-class molecular chaperone